MKLKTSIYILLITNILIFPIISFSQATLTGKVTDATSGDPLTGATLYIPDLKTGVAADQNGMYRFTGLPSGTLLIQVSFLGYGAVTKMVDLKNTAVMDFTLSEKAIEAREVVITGSGISTDNSRSSNSITPISKQTLYTTPSTNLINAISTVPGLSEITTGGDISKPVIRGLSYNHVVTLNEGVRQEGQQWGDEHGIEIDQFAADRVEVLKGPASLFYGSDAMGGVINILEPMHAPLNTIRGEVASQFATNNMMTSNTLMAEGNQNGFTWRVRGSYKNAASFKTPPGYIFNTGYNELNYSAMVGLNRKWGYSHLHYSRYDANIGMAESDSFADTRVPTLPFQNVRHNKVTSVSNLVFGKNQVRINLGYQNNDRREYEDSKDNPTLFMHLDTWTYDGKFTRLMSGEIEFVAGISGMTQSNSNKGEEYLVPAYNLQDLGAFVYLKKSWPKWTLNAGLRFDHRYVDGRSLYLDTLGQPAPKGDTVFPGFTVNFSAVSGSAGFTVAVAKAINFKFNIGSGFRAPNIAELGSNGVHPGTLRYELGNPLLKPENSIQADGELSAGWDLLDITLSAYYNYIFNYIYQRNIDGESIVKSGESYLVYRFVQGNSTLTGFELEIDLHPVEPLHFENSIDFVIGTNRSTNTPLPFIPALHTVHKLRWNFTTPRHSFLAMPYVEVGAQFHGAQHRIDEFETVTPGYFLLDASIGSRLRVANQLWTVFISGSNLTNTKYYDHLSRLKEIGVYNPGWGVTLGVVVPVGIYAER